METTAAALKDRLDISDVVYRWCRAIDRKDFESIYACFHADAFDDHIFYRGDIDGLVRCLRERHTKISFSMHAVSNVLIEFVNEHCALVESYVKVVQRRPLKTAQDHASKKPSRHVPDDSHVSEVYCRYVDVFERRCAFWKISKRTLIIDTAMEYTDREPLHRLPDEMSVNRGRRDLSDAVFAMRAQLNQE